MGKKTAVWQKKVIKKDENLQKTTGKLNRLQEQLIGLAPHAVKTHAKIRHQIKKVRVKADQLTDQLIRLNNRLPAVIVVVTTMSLLLIDRLSVTHVVTMVTVMGMLAVTFAI